MFNPFNFQLRSQELWYRLKQYKQLSHLVNLPFCTLFLDTLFSNVCITETNPGKWSEAIVYFYWVITLANKYISILLFIGYSSLIYRWYEMPIGFPCFFNHVLIQSHKEYNQCGISRTEQTMFILKHCVITIHTLALYKNNKDT